MSRFAVVPAEPLLGRLDAIEGLQYADGTIGKTMVRARATGFFSVGQADRLCVRVLRLHPANVYGDAWWNAEPLTGVSVS